MREEEVLKGHTRRMKTGCGNLYITINEDNGQPKEVFIRLGKAGGCAASQSEALGRLITLALRAGVEVSKLVKQLQGIGCHQPQGFGDTKILSCADAVGRCLGKTLKKSEKEAEPEPTVEPKPEPKKKPEKKIVEVPVSPPPTPETLEIDHEAAIEWAVSKAKATPTFEMTPCPDCGSGLIMEEGCVKCYVCGFTKC